MDRIHVVQDRDWWQDFVNMVEPSGSIDGGEFLE
jgi:hypothetical protein